MIRWRVLMDYDQAEDAHVFTIKIPNVIPRDALKRRILDGDCRLRILDYARELIEKEVIWSECPDWDLDYGICPSTTFPLGGNGDTPDV